jgi:hypothetical protein
LYSEAQTRNEETRMSSGVFRKTDDGKAEIAQRRAGLAPAARQLLILVNGSDSVNALMAKGLSEVRTHLDTLLAMRLIEAVPEPVKPVAVVAAPPPVAAAPAPATPAPDAQRLSALQRKALQHLHQHFGPDTALVAQALLAARTPVAYQQALDGIESKLAIYMGRKQAARELEGLRMAA